MLVDVFQHRPGQGRIFCEFTIVVAFSSSKARVIANLALHREPPIEEVTNSETLKIAIGLYSNNRHFFLASGTATVIGVHSKIEHLLNDICDKIWKSIRGLDGPPLLFPCVVSSSLYIDVTLRKPSAA